MKNIFLLIFVLNIFFMANLSSKEKKSYVNETQLAVSQLGFRPESSKLITLLPSKEDIKKLPDEIPFYIQKIGSRKKRIQKIPAAYNSVYNWPYEISKGKYDPKDTSEGVYKGTLKKKETRWGTFWQGEFTEFCTPGVYQIETEMAGFSTPFAIDEKIYERLIRSYLIYNQSQRSGTEVPGVRPVETLDDAVLDTDGTPVPCSGGWFDAGDTRKWICQTITHEEALSQIARFANPAFRQAALDEMEYGNKYFHNMINAEGQVYEDVGAGPLRAGMSYDEAWWCENHAGCIAKGTAFTDNLPGTGDEREVRTNYNPVCQLQFIRNQAIISKVLPPVDGIKCFLLAEKAWKYNREHPHDGRTLFRAHELAAAVELYRVGSKLVTPSDIEKLAQLLLERQDKTPATTDALTGYFMEADGDGFRSVVWSAEPVLSLLRMIELNIPELNTISAQAQQAVRSYFDNYLLKDAQSNPFGVTPWGIIANPLQPEIETYRDAGNGKFVRTFIQLFNSQQMPHGGNAVIQQHTYALAMAGALLKERKYTDHAEKLIQWTMGHNTASLCTFIGVGFRHPVQASYMNYLIPDAALNGFLGNLDDTPYIETSNAIEWSTQETWGVPFYHMIGAITYLNKK